VALLIERSEDIDIVYNMERRPVAIQSCAGSQHSKIDTPLSTFFDEGKRIVKIQKSKSNANWGALIACGDNGR
jgi:hypothetical protein